MRRVYRIDTNITPEEDEIITSQIDEVDRNNIDGIIDEIEVFDGLNDNGTIFNYFLCEEHHLEVVQRIADKFKVKVEINDITEMFLNDVVDIDNKKFRDFKNEHLNRK